MGHNLLGRHNKKNLLCTATTVPWRGSMTRICLSLHVVANRLPSRFHDTEKIVSG